MRYSILIIATLFTGSFLEGCVSDGPLGRRQAAKMIRQAETTVCKLSPALQEKPEFRALRHEDLCDVDVVVTGIIQSAETEAEAEYDMTMVPNRPALERWLGAMEELEIRLQALEGTESGELVNIKVVYRDPTDGQTFTSAWPLHRQITAAPEWKSLQNLKEGVQQMLQRERIERSSRAGFRLYDDGWRLVTNDG